MKKLFFATLFTWVAFCQAQQFKVYSVVGEAKANGITIVQGMSLECNSLLTISDNSKVILLDLKNKRLYTIQAPANDKVEKLLPKGTAKDISEAYFQYITSKLLSSDEEEQRQAMPRAATSFRDGDTTLIKDIYNQDK